LVSPKYAVHETYVPGARIDSGWIGPDPSTGSAAAGVATAAEATPAKPKEAARPPSRKRRYGDAGRKVIR
jgi:hypothetical protein